MAKRQTMSPLDRAERIKNFDQLVIGKKYIATGIDNSVELIYRGETPNDGHKFEGDDWLVKGYLYAKHTIKLISWGLVECN